MAWISVHEQVISSKLRNLAKEISCSQNEALGILIRLWLWAVTNVKKDGCIMNATKEDIAEILTNGLDKRYHSIDVVDALIKTHWIDEKEGLYIHDWAEWQGAWYKAMEVRERNTERKREERKKKKAEPRQQEILTVVNSQAPKKEQVAKGYEKDFERFWSVYPRKVGKGEAYKKYKARLNDGWSAEELFNAADNYAKLVTKERTEQQYIKHPKTFLSESTPFADFIKKGKKSDDDSVPYAEWR